MLEDGLTEIDPNDGSGVDFLEHSNDPKSIFDEGESVAAVLPETPQKLYQSTPRSKETPNGTFTMDDFTIRVINPAKVGEGMSAYVVYRVELKTAIPLFRSRELCVSRRFSDFLGLHEKLQQTHLKHGIIIPPAPGKDTLVSTKVKMSKDSILEKDFVEKRRTALERFLFRLLIHPVLRLDPDLREFLEYSGELPRATSTQILSSNSALKMIKNIGDAVGKLTHKVDDVDEGPDIQYFEEKARDLDCWERQLKQLHGALSALSAHEQELASSNVTLSRAISLLANVEEHTGLAQALNHLAEAGEQSAQCYATQADAGATFLLEYANDLLGIIQAGKDVLNERHKIHRNWRASEAALRSKRDARLKMEASARSDQRKLSTLSLEADELSKRVEQGETSFEAISATIKSEFGRLEVNRFINFKQAATEYLEVMLRVQVKLLESWETYLIHAKSIM